MIEAIKAFWLKIRGGVELILAAILAIFIAEETRENRKLERKVEDLTEDKKLQEFNAAAQAAQEKADVSEANLDRVIGEFEREYGTGKNNV